MIQIEAMDRVRRHAKAALEAQSFVDTQGVLGVPTSTDGHQWDTNWDVTAIVGLLDQAVVLRWNHGALEIKTRYGDPRYFRLYRPGDNRIDAPAEADVAVEAFGVWEVTAPDGHVMIHAGIELADFVYREIAPAGSHLHLAPVREGAAA